MASRASYNITIDHTSAPAGSDHSSSSSITDGEDSSGTGVQVSPTSPSGSPEYSDPLDENEGDWVVYPDEIGPSDSASRPRTSNQDRPIVEAPRPEPARRQSAHRRRPNERGVHHHHHPAPRARRPHLPTSSGSVDSNEEWPAYGRGPPQYYGRAYAHYGHATAASPPNYAPSYSTAQGYPPLHAPPPGQQLVPFASPPAPYSYPPYAGAAGGQAPGYFPPGQHAAPNMGNPMISHPGAPPYTGQEMMHHPQATQFYPYPPQGYPAPQAVGPPALYHPYPVIYSPSPVPTANTPPPPAVDTSKNDENFARIEKLFLDQKAEIAAKEAAAIKAADEAAAKAAADKKYAEDIAAAANEAAAKATEEAEKKAAEKAAEEAAKAKAAAEEAEKKAAEAAAALPPPAPAPPPPPPPPEEKKKPIRFKDAVGRKFSFPFHLCNTWDVSSRLVFSTGYRLATDPVRYI
ncbi:MAG: hypothetical protein Q9223_004768 [Gallowayella weberi]